MKAKPGEQCSIGSFVKVASELGRTLGIGKLTELAGKRATVAYFDEPGEAFNKPTILLLVNWYLDHRWRTGADVSQAFPYIVLGFAFSGDLIDWRP